MTAHKQPRRAAALRPLGLPREMQVHADAEGYPVTLERRGTWRRVEAVYDVWRVAEEWWREEPQERTYFRVLLEGGQPLTLFHDGVTNRWYEQHYAAQHGGTGGT